MLTTIKQANTLIDSGKTLMIAGSEYALRSLNRGTWVGGTIPYFMTDEGGLFSDENVFINLLPDYMERVKIRSYSEESLSNIPTNAYDNGFNFIIMPAFSNIHKYFALNVYNIDNIFSSPLVGWISGISLDDLDNDNVKPLVFDGSTGEALDNRAIVMHVQLPESKHAEIDIINVFEQGNGDEIVFPKTGFNVSECLINGKKHSFIDYLKENDIDTRLPLVGDYGGIKVNVSIHNITDDNVTFYAPALKNIGYKFAKPVSQYVQSFSKEMSSHYTDRVFFSCNCILNYLYAELEGKKTGKFAGPITFGEIAYILLNQTLVYLSIKDK